MRTCEHTRTCHAPPRKLTTPHTQGAGDGAQVHFGKQLTAVGAGKGRGVELRFADGVCVCVCIQMGARAYACACQMRLRVCECSHLWCVV